MLTIFGAVSYTIFPIPLILDGPYTLNTIFDGIKVGDNIAIRLPHKQYKRGEPWLGKALKVSARTVVRFEFYAGSYGEVGHIIQPPHKQYKKGKPWLGKVLKVSARTIRFEFYAGSYGEVGHMVYDHHTSNTREENRGLERF